MRENRLSASEGGATLKPSSLPVSVILSLRDRKPFRLRDGSKDSLSRTPAVNSGDADFLPDSHSSLSPSMSN
jgi:hypothetical protein